MRSQGSVPRETSTPEGLCRRCGREPRNPGQRWGKRCNAANMRRERAGRQPTAEESARLQALADLVRPR